MKMQRWEKIFIFGQIFKSGPHMTENIIWVQENPNLALQHPHRLSQTFVKIFFNLPQCVISGIAGTQIRLFAGYPNPISSGQTICPAILAFSMDQLWSPVLFQHQVWIDCGVQCPPLILSQNISKWMTMRQAAQ